MFLNTRNEEKGGNMRTIEENICQAIEFYIKKAIDDLDIDRVVIARIDSNFGPDTEEYKLGRYKIVYQGGRFTANSLDPHVRYAYDMNVYVLVHDDTFTILSGVNATIADVEKIVYDLTIATKDRLGGIKVGEGLNITSDGTLSADISNLPIATVENTGVVKPDGDTILIDADGTLHGASKVDIATVEKPGIVKPDGETIAIQEDGTISVAKAQVRIHDHNFEQLGYSYDEADTTLKLLMMPIRLEHEIDSDDYENYEIKKF